MKQFRTFIFLMTLALISCQEEPADVVESNQLTKPSSNSTEMKENQNYTSTILVEQEPEVVFNAVKNFRAW
jgi:hypothetical protein